MKNLAISRFYDEGYYKKCGVYECSEVVEGMIEIQSMNGVVRHDVEDDGFVFILNVNDELDKFIEHNAIVFI